MSSPNWTDDDGLMHDLGAAVRSLPTDEKILAAARTAWSWRTVDLDLEIAEILYDSNLDEDVLVRGDGPDGYRTLTFQGEHVGVEIELSGSRLQGQLIPPGPGSVRLLTPQGEFATTAADEVGCFELPMPPRGSVRLECVTDAGRVTTDWVTV